MLAKRFAFVLVFACGSASYGGLVHLELVPDIPGPHCGGETLTVDVNLIDTGVGEITLRRVALDFTWSDSALQFDEEFEFDLPFGGALYATYPELPLPSTAYAGTDAHPMFMLTLPEGGSVHLGSFTVTVPMWPSLFVLDVVNRGALSVNEGTRFDYDFEDPAMIHSSSGDITGGMLWMGPWGSEPLTLLLLAAGGAVIVRRRR